MNRLASIIFVSLLATSDLQAEDANRLKVFILAGQSNMEGQAVSDLDGKDYNLGKGALQFLLRGPEKAPALKHLVRSADRSLQRYSRHATPIAE